MDYRRRPAIILLILIVTLPCHTFGTAKDPIAGQAFAEFQARQVPELQKTLTKVFPESEGYLVSGPIDIRVSGHPEVERLYHSIHVISPDLSSLEVAMAAFDAQDQVKVKAVEKYIDTAKHRDPAGFRGVLAEVSWGDNDHTILIATIQQMRWLIWFRQFTASEGARSPPQEYSEYSVMVSDYLFSLDSGAERPEPPEASAHGLPQQIDLFAPPPDYVISGYQNYLDFLYAHSEICTDFVRGVKAFLPTDSLLSVLIEQAPKEAFPNKEAPMLQHEYRKFFDRGGDTRVMETLTKVGFDTLAEGEYFFAVSLTGKIRFGRELLRSEVERLERQTGRKVPRANHAFLFPGEPVLTAGAFFIERGDIPRISRVTAQSGHYFYSNVSATIREDISQRSDYYLLTLGHFFRALRNLGIPYNDILISKF